MSFEDQIAKIVRDGAKELALKNAAAVKQSMGSDGNQIRYEWVATPNGLPERPGRLEIKGPTELAERFSMLLRQRMEQ